VQSLTPAARKVGDLGRYRLIAELARGGMGIVYLAIARGPAGFHKLLVIKELKPHLVEDRGILSMFLDEARLAARLSHEHIVQTVEVGSEGSRHYIVMEYLEGHSFHQLLARAKRLGREVPLPIQLRILAGALAGLHAAHDLIDFDGTALGVVHRDVSPQNVFVTYSDNVKVVDFGIAKALDSTTVTRTGMLKGKVAYLSPEQARGLPVDRRTDVFAVGVMLFQAATGRRLWEGANDMQILHRLCSGEVPRPSEIAVVAPELERIVCKAMAIAPDDRYATAAELLADVESYLATLEVVGRRASDVGKLLQELFENDRARIRAVVDEQVKTLKGLATSEVRAVDLVQLDVSSSPSGTPSGVYAPQAEGDRARVNSTPTVRPGLAAGRLSSWIFVTTGLAVMLVAGVLSFVFSRGVPPSGTASATPKPTRTRLQEQETTAAVPTPSTTPSTKETEASASIASASETVIAGAPTGKSPIVWKKPKTTTSASATSALVVPVTATAAVTSATTEPKPGKPKHEIDKDDPYEK
jgi:serine/threonine-protein kinase